MASPADSRPEKSLSRLMLELLWQLAVLLVPIFLVTVLPPLLALATLLVCAALMTLAARLGWPRGARGLARVMSGAAFGFGFSLGRALPAYWDIAGAAIGMFAALACVASLERRLGLSPAKPSQAGASGGPSAWGGDEPQHTPEGQPIRVFNHGEIAMGGPTYCDYLFPDGVLLQGVGSSARFSNDGRYFAATLPSRQQWGLLILDRPQRRLYHCDYSEFWELDSFADDTLDGRHSPLVDNSPRQHGLEQLLQGARAVDLVPVADLWLEPGAWHERLTGAPLEETSPDGAQRLHGQMALPASLASLPQPLEPLRAPPYRLSLNGQASGLLIGAEDSRVWSADGRALACLARQESDPETSSYWLWQQDLGWRRLPEPWVASPAEPSFHWHQLLSLDDQHLRIDAYLDCAQPDHGTYGYRLHSIHSDTDTQVGHDPQGRMLIADLPLARTQLVMPLDSLGQRGASDLESAPLLDGQRARLSWLADNRDGLGAYRCCIGDWQLPGRWQLDHRVSDCGRYLALLPFVEAPAVCGQVQVADLQQRRLLAGPPMLPVRLLDFRDGRLSLAAITGRLDNPRHSQPLQRANQPAPPAEEAATFCQERDDSRLLYEVLRVQVDDHSLRLLPRWRLVDRPQSATADGDFIQPAANGEDAAWLFGSETDYADSCLRPGSPRLGGHLLTASGCALSDLAPSMIWSPAARYLALTRYCSERNDRQEDRYGWQVLLLDVRDHCLRTWPERLHHRPQFEAFSGDSLRLRLFTRDWQAADDDDCGRLLKLNLSELLSLPGTPLIEHLGLWLDRAELTNLSAWQAVQRPQSLYFGAPSEEG